MCVCVILSYALYLYIYIYIYIGYEQTWVALWLIIWELIYELLTSSTIFWATSTGCKVMSSVICLMITKFSVYVVCDVVSHCQLSFFLPYFFTIPLLFSALKPLFIQKIKTSFDNFFKKIEISAYILSQFHYD